MSALPGGGFSGRRFWGIQVNATEKEKNVRVNSDTELHISKAIVEFKNLFEPHEANCSVGVGVRYEEYCCDCSNVRRNLGEICALHPKQNQQCVVCVIKSNQKSETDLDLNFVGGQNLTFFYTYHCTCNFENPYVVVNLSGYEVSLDM